MAIENQEIKYGVNFFSGIVLSNTLFAPFFIPQKLSLENCPSWIERYLNDLRNKIMFKLDVKIASIIIASVATLIHPEIFFYVMAPFGLSLVYLNSVEVKGFISIDKIILTDIDNIGRRELAQNKGSIVDKRVALMRELRKVNPIFISLCYLISSLICFAYIQGVEVVTFSTLATSISFFSGVIFNIVIESLI